MHIMQTKRTVITVDSKDVIEIEVSDTSICIMANGDDSKMIVVSREDLAKNAGYRNAIETLAKDLLALVSKARPEGGGVYR